MREKAVAKKSRASKSSLSEKRMKTINAKSNTAPEIRNSILSECSMKFLKTVAKMWSSTKAVHIARAISGNEYANRGNPISEIPYHTSHKYSVTESVKRNMNTRM